MKVKCLQTTGLGYFTEVNYDKPEPAPNEIEVKAVMTGVCRSDIDMMKGDFIALPLNMQGHEGLGIVTKVGAEVGGLRVRIKGVQVGDFVATRGEPAYADYYNCRDGEFVVVKELHPKYILEPVACGINCVVKEFEEREDTTTLIIGSGFLAWVCYHILKLRFPNMKVDVIGSNNENIWEDKLSSITEGTYDNVIDLSGKYELGTEIMLNNNALIVDAVGKAVSKNEAQTQLWKACTTVKPSPRTPEFISAMMLAGHLIESGKLNVDKFWSKCYNRSTEWKQAFEDGKNRPKGYNRGYIKWD